MNVYVYVCLCNFFVYQIGLWEVVVGIVKKLQVLEVNCKWGSGGGQIFESLKSNKKVFG